MKANALPRSMASAALALLALLALLGFGAPPAASADAEGSLPQLEEQLRVVQEWKQKQAEVVRKMREELAQNPSHPDASKLEPLSTAGGYRSETYRRAPDYIQRKIDEFYKPLPVGDALALGLGMANPRAQYVVEIARSERLIQKYLEPEERRLEARIEVLRAEAEERRAAEEARRRRAPEATLDHRAQQEANVTRLEGMLGAMEREVAALGQAEEQLRDAQLSVEAEEIRWQVAGITVGAALRIIEAEDSSLKSHLAGCRGAAALRARIVSAVAQVEQQERSVTQGLDRAEAMAATCRTREDAARTKALYDAAEGLTARIGLAVGRIRGNNDELQEIIASADASRSILQSAESAAAQIGAEASRDFTLMRRAVETAERLAADLAGRRAELLARIGRLRGAFPADDPEIDRRFEALAARVKAGTALPAADAWNPLRRAEADAERIKRIDASARRLLAAMKALPPCPAVAPADDAVERAEAAYTGALVWLGAAAPLPEKAAACLASSQPPAQALGGLPPAGTPGGTSGGPDPPPLQVSIFTPPDAAGTGEREQPPPAPPQALSAPPPAQAVAPDPPANPIPEIVSAVAGLLGPLGNLVPGFGSLPALPGFPVAPGGPPPMPPDAWNRGGPALAAAGSRPTTSASLPQPQRAAPAVRVYTGTFTRSGSVTAGGKTATCPTTDFPLTIRVYPNEQVEWMVGGYYWVQVHAVGGTVRAVTCTTRSTPMSFRGGLAGNQVSGVMQVQQGAHNSFEGTLRDGAAAGTGRGSGTITDSGGNAQHWTTGGRWAAWLAR